MENLFSLGTLLLFGHINTVLEFCILCFRIVGVGVVVVPSLNVGGAISASKLASRYPGRVFFTAGKLKSIHERAVVFSTPVCALMCTCGDRVLRVL